MVDWLLEVRGEIQTCRSWVWKTRRASDVVGKDDRERDAEDLNQVK